MFGAQCNGGSMRAYEWLLRLYPDDVRFGYEQEMLEDFRRRYRAARQLGSKRCLVFLTFECLKTTLDIAAERTNSLYSHRSFHGRGRPNPGMVRPPNMGKAEWFSSND